MNQLNLTYITSYIQNNIGPEFHDKKIVKLKKLTINDVLQRKNPYMFKAKRTDSAHDFVHAVLDATVSSGEETIFGNFLEKIAIEVCKQVRGGRKSGIKGLDLEFEKGKSKYLISIKSGPNWGNSDQLRHLIKNFKDAKKTLATSGGSKGMNVICIEACCYGKDNNPEKGTHQKLCGHKFWELISANKTLYRDLIKPLGYKAKEKNDEIQSLYTQKLTLFTAEFIEKFCKNGLIDWDKLVIYNSGK